LVINPARPGFVIVHKKCLTSRQSQRRDWGFFDRFSGGRNTVVICAAWLIFDVRQKSMRATTLFLILSATFVAACAPQRPVDVDRIVRDAALIVLFTHDGKEGKHRLAEVLKDDGSYPLKFKVGDSVRMNLSDPKHGVGTIIAIIERGSFGSELMPITPCTEMPVRESSIPALNGISVDQLRVMATKGRTSR
jgi:hypothetical protein